MVGRRAIRQEEGEQDAALCRARMQYDAGGHPPIAVSVVWSGIALRKAARKTIAGDLAKIVLEHLPASGEWVALGGDDADAPINDSRFERIEIVHVSAPRPWESLYQWDGAEADSVFVQFHVSRKESRPQGYQVSYDATWLLLYTRGTTPSSGFDISAEALAENYHSTFDRVFTLDLLHRKAAELSVGKGEQPGR